MFEVAVSEYVLRCQEHGLSDLGDCAQHALLADWFDEPKEGSEMFVTVARGTEQPFLVVVQRYQPHSYGFNPGVLIVPETDRLFVGAGERILAYDLREPARLWEDAADFGFWGWARHGDTVVMSAELELAAWELHGRKLWTTFVEPPWSYCVVGDEVRLDVMGRKSSFNLTAGPAQ